MTPATVVPLDSKCPLFAQVFSFGIAGFMASITIEEASPLPSTLDNSPFMSPISNSGSYVLPFSAKTADALNCQISDAYEWARKTGCSLYDLGTLLSICREHHSKRLIIIASDIEDLRGISVEISGPNYIKSESAEEVHMRLTTKYNEGLDVDFTELYDPTNVPLLCQYLQTFPTYTFDRTLYRRNQSSANHLSKSKESIGGGNTHMVLDRFVQSPSTNIIEEAIASILNIPAYDIPYDKSIFDLGIDSISSIELAATLSQAFDIYISATELYSLLTVKGIFGNILEKTGIHSTETISTHFTQADVDTWVAKYGSPLDDSQGPTVKKERDNSVERR